MTNDTEYGNFTGPVHVSHELDELGEATGQAVVFCSSLCQSLCTSGNWSMEVEESPFDGFLVLCSGCRAPLNPKYLTLPVPGEVFDGDTVIASCWQTDNYDGGYDHDLCLASLLLLTSTPGAFYRTVQTAAREEDGPKWGEVNTMQVFPNIVPAAKGYQEESGCW